MDSGSSSRRDVPLAPTGAAEIEAQVRRLEAELAACRAREANLQRQWAAWLALASHDLRSPLTLVLGYAQGMLRHLPDGKATDHHRHDLNAIVYGARRLDKMIGQIVDGARLEAEQLTFDVRGLHLGTIVQEEVRKLRRTYPDRSIRTDVPDRLPAVQGDSRRVGQILGTFLSNAAVFSPVDAPIAVKARSRDGRVVVAVTDRGIGLTEAESARVFERGFRSERAREARREGLGLSLSIAAALAARVGAELSVESPGPDRGATFSLSLRTVEYCALEDVE